MSNALRVYCRAKPDLPMEGELEGAPVQFAVRPAAPSDDAILVGREHRGMIGGSLRLQRGEMAWVVELDFPSSVEFDAFVAGGLVIAGRSGGGVLWSPVANKVVEVVAAGSGRAKGNLLDAVQRAFDTGYAYDDEDDDDEGDDDEGDRALSRPRPSARAVEFVLQGARSYAPRGFEPLLSTRVAELPGLGYPGAWATLLLGAGFDEFSPVDPESEPRTLEDVARHFDALAAATEAARVQAAREPISAPAAPANLLDQLQGLEVERSNAANNPISGAAYSDERRSHPTCASWWRSADGEVAAVFDGTGGKYAGNGLVRLMSDAMSEPPPGALVERARWPILRAQAAALAKLGPAFVAFGTIASAAVSGTRGVVAHVGDTRVYRIRGGACEQLTVDHSWAFDGERQRRISRGIGMRDGFKIDIREVEVAPGDVLVLVTHDVWEAVEAAELAELVVAHGARAAAIIVGRAGAAKPQSGAAIAVIPCGAR